MVVSAFVIVLIGAAPAHGADWVWFEDPSALPDAPTTTEMAPIGPTTQVARTWYTAWNGRQRGLRVAMPIDAFSAGRPLPLVVAVRPSGGTSICAEEFGDLPGLHGFAVACIDGQGAFSRGYSFAAPGHVDDIARVPALVRERVPLLPIDLSRIYVVGVSMGASEALLAALRHPRTFAGAVALDPTVDLGVRFEQSPRPRRLLIRAECDGPPRLQPGCYAERSPLDALASAKGGPLISIWFSEIDTVTSRADQIPAFIDAAQETPIGERLRLRIGSWRHAALWWDPAGRIALLADMGLVPRTAAPSIEFVRRTSAPIERREPERERPAPAQPAPQRERPPAAPPQAEPARDRPQQETPQRLPVAEPEPQGLRAPMLGRIESTPAPRLGLRFASGPSARLVVPVPAPGERLAFEVPLHRDGWFAGTWRFEVRREGVDTVVRMAAPVRGNPGTGPMRATIADGALRITIPLERGNYSGFPRRLS